jgi:hypothetical protein
MAEQVQVPKNTGLVDSLQAAGRSAVVIVTFITAFLALLKVHDIAGMIALIQNNGGEVVGAIALIIGTVTYLYGVYKSKKRGNQLETVVLQVPDPVAKFKGD